MKAFLTNIGEDEKTLQILQVVVGDTLPEYTAKMCSDVQRMLRKAGITNTWIYPIRKASDRIQITKLSRE